MEPILAANETPCRIHLALILHHLNCHPQTESEDIHKGNKSFGLLTLKRNIQIHFDSLYLFGSTCNPQKLKLFPSTIKGYGQRATWIFCCRMTRKISQHVTPVHFQFVQADQRLQEAIVHYSLGLGQTWVRWKEVNSQKHSTLAATPICFLKSAKEQDPKEVGMATVELPARVNHHHHTQHTLRESSQDSESL